jgi:acyl-[acyl-carrier-protein]-phospholipid O-acyltransferase / long-chain-fatty-acid--[acyl-carrier-protein] ligase
MTSKASSKPFPISSLLIAQFFGAFNDNAFKIVIALIGIAVVESQGELAMQEVTQNVGIALTLPLMLGSIPAMVFGDRVSKRSLIVWTKFAEVCLMTLGTFALWWQPDGWLPYVVLAGMGLQSAMFAPGKYGLLPEVLSHDKLPSANGKLEAASFLAIILGTVAGGLLLDLLSDARWLVGALLMLFSVVGFFAALRLPHVPPSGQGESATVVLKTAWRSVRGDRVLWLATLGTVAFWAIASLLGQDMLVYAKGVLGFADQYSGLPFALFAIGVGAGSLLAGRLSRGRIETGLVPLGAIGLALSTAAMGVFVPGTVGTFVLMVALGVSSGFVVVPLNSLVQWRAPAGCRGAVIAFINMVSFAGMMLGNLVCTWLAAAGLDSAGILLAVAVVTLVATVWAIWLLPDALLRLLVVMAAHTLYRVRILGAEKMPEKGGAMLVPNHVSFLDGLFLLAATDRQIRFVVEQHWYERPWLKPFMKALGVIPISAAGGPRVVLKALRDAGKALDDGEVVCLFAEGEISRMGSTLPFRRGLKRIVKGRNAPIIPVHLDRVYGSFGSSRQGRFQWLPTQIPCPVTVSFGEPMPNDSLPEDVRVAVEHLAERAASVRADELRPLHVAFVKRVRKAPWRHCLADSQGKRLSRISTLAGAIVMARRLRSSWGDQKHVGIMLPPSIAGALAAFAASLSGRTAVSLNYTVGAAAMRSAVRQAGLRSLVTSRAFLERLPKEMLDGLAGLELILLEDLMQGVSPWERMTAVLRAQLLPIGMLERACGATRRVTRDDTAVILFSSGSTGEPKGIMLTHRNLQANCDAIAQVLPAEHTDKLVGVLPMFHSFGNLALWYAVGQGAGMVFHPNPLEAAAVGYLVATHQATVLIATPTFLQLYNRRCEPGQFGSLRLVLTGAEKLTDELADAFADRFGLRPIQGYGATECAPAIAVSAPGYRAPGFYQSGARRGSVGRPVPGVTVRIVDPESKEPVPMGETGMVLVRGSNVMQGYLGRDDLTASAMHDGSYITGDIGRVDADGFLFLTDRLSRFSKIGGEMVPHGVIEEHLQECCLRHDRAFAVCGIPDARKGERLAVLTTLSETQLTDVLEQMSRRGLPALFLPRKHQFVHVSELPLLGTGKLDLRKVKEVAIAAQSEQAPEADA